MDDPALALVLEECLARLEAGEDIDAITRGCPGVHSSVEPMLHLASRLRDTADDAVEVPLEFLKDLGEYLQDQMRGPAG